MCENSDCIYRNEEGFCDVFSECFDTGTILPCPEDRTSFDINNIAQPNEHGVYEDQNTDIIRYKIESWNLYIIIRIAHTGENEWRSGYRVMTRLWGAGSPPSILSPSYESYNAALIFIVNELINKFKKEDIHFKFNSIKEINWLKSLLQMNIFDNRKEVHFG